MRNFFLPCGLLLSVVLSSLAGAEQAGSLGGAASAAQKQQLSAQQVQGLAVQTAVSVGGMFPGATSMPLKVLTAQGAEGASKDQTGTPGAPKVNSEQVAQNLPKIENASSATAAVSQTSQLRGAIQQVQANPLDAQARANLQSNLQRQSVANQMLVRDAASGKFDTSGYKKLSAAMATAVTVPEKRAEATPVTAAAAKATNVAETFSPTGTNDSIGAPVRRAESEPVEVKMPSSASSSDDVQTALRDSDTAAKFVTERVQNELNPAQIASIPAATVGNEKDVPTAFTQALLTAAVGPAAANEKELPTTPTPVAEADEVPKTPSGVGLGSLAEDTTSALQRSLTAEEKKLLGAIVEASVGVAVGAAAELTPEMIAGDPDAALIAGMKKASESEPAYRKMLGDLNSIVETKILHNVGLRKGFAARSKKSFADVASSLVADAAPVVQEDSVEDSYAPLRRACAGLISVGTLFGLFYRRRRAA